WARLREEANVSLDADRVDPAAPPGPSDLPVLLERGEVVYYPICPFPLLAEADRAFLLGQELGRAAHKNISYDPASGRAGGFARLLERYGEQAGLPGRVNHLGWASRLLETSLRLFRPGRAARSVYDSFMLRFHHFLKRCEDLQERGLKRVWNFPPGSAWLAMT